MLKAVTRQASAVDAKIAIINSQLSSDPTNPKRKISTANFFDHHATKEDVAVMVTEADFLEAERELVPSVSMKELEHYKRVRAQFEKPVAEKVDFEGKGKEVPRDQALAVRSNGIGKGDAKIPVQTKGKGKGKMNAWEEEDEEEDEDSFYSGDGENGANRKGKGKAREVQMDGFGEGEGEDEELY